MAHLNREDRFSDEPKQMYLSALVRVATEIEFNLYFRKQPIHEILPQITGLVHMLEEGSKENLKETTTKLKQFRKNVRLITDRQQVEKLYSEVMSYLLAHHLKEFNFATPRYGKVKLELPT
jgi:hypothetical protein